MFCLLIIITACTLRMNAQSDTTGTLTRARVIRETLQVLTGVTLGTNRWAEVGIAKNISETQGRHPFSVTIFGSSELKLNDKFVWGPKFGVWAAGVRSYEINEVSEDEIMMKPAKTAGDYRRYTKKYF